MSMLDVVSIVSGLIAALIGFALLYWCFTDAPNS